MHRLHHAGLACALTLGLASAAVAQTPPPAVPASVPAVLEIRAEETRQQLQTILWSYPPALRDVIRIDPSLLERPDYLAPYPRLTAFLAQHPEVLRDPGFFFGRPGDDARDFQPLDFVAATLAGVGVFITAMTVLVIVGSLLRQVIEHRRWLRESRTQVEIHTRLLDRMQSNEDLLAYIQTPAGRRFLEFAPPATSGASRAIIAPLGRILWSAQLGIVLLMLGLGLVVVQNSLSEEIRPGFYVLASVAIALGVGGIISAGAAYVISARMGILPERTEAS